MSRQEAKIEQGAQPLLDEGEQVLAAVVARPRGWTQTMAGSAMLGRKQQKGAYAAAEEAGFRLASPMALVVTPKRLLTLKIGSPIGLGIGGDVKELVSAVPIGDVDSIEVKRLLLGRVITVTVRGAPVKLEVNAMAGTKRLADAFNRAKAAA